MEKIGHEGCYAWRWLCAFVVFGILNYAFPFMFVTNSSFHYLGLNNLLMAYEDKSAYAMCVFSLALGPTMEPITFMGKTPVWLTLPNLNFLMKG